jgi:hypothetical protein
MNGATCQSYDSNYFCICPQYYSGMNCQISNNVCTSRPCRNGGTCIALGSQYLCLCKAGYSGSNCQSCI